MPSIAYTRIGTIHSPFEKPQGTPIQPVAARDAPGRVELRPEFAEGLRDLEGFSHLILLYHFHLSEGYDLTVIPFLDEVSHGLFATRAPRRPNPIGLSVVRLVRIEGTILYLLDVDVVDGTPLLDLKPYVPIFQNSDVVRVGWLEGKSREARERRADERFLGKA